MTDTRAAFEDEARELIASQPMSERIRQALAAAHRRGWEERGEADAKEMAFKYVTQRRLQTPRHLAARSEGMEAAYAYAETAIRALEYKEPKP